MFTKNVMARIRRLHPEYWRISRAISIVTIFLLATKGVAAFREIAIAQHYGTSSAVDAYMFILNTMLWPGAVWTSILGVILIPIFVRIQSGDRADAKLFGRELFGLSLASSAVIGVIAGIAIWIMVDTGAVSLQGEAHRQALAIVAPMILLVPLGFANTILAQRVMSDHRQANTLLEALPPLATVIFVFLMPTTSPWPLVVGVVFGFALQFAALLGIQHSFDEWVPPKLSFRAASWSGFWRSFGILALGVGLMSFGGIVDQFMAADLKSGSVAILGYANRLLALLTALGATAVTRAILPTLSAMVVKGDSATRLLASRWSGAAFVVGLAVIVIGWPLIEEFVRLIFQRGKFSAADTSAVSDAVRFGLIQMPFYFSGLVLSQLLASRNQVRRIFNVGVVCGVTKIAGNILLVPSFGIRGFMVATALMYATSLCVQYYYLRN